MGLAAVTAALLALIYGRLSAKKRQRQEVRVKVPPSNGRSS